MDGDAPERLAIVDLLTGSGRMFPNAGIPEMLFPVVESWDDVARTAVGGAALRSPAINGFGDIADGSEPACLAASLSALAEDGQWLTISMEFALLITATEPESLIASAVPFLAAGPVS